MFRHLKNPSNFKFFYTLCVVFGIASFLLGITYSQIRHYRIGQDTETLTLVGPPSIESLADASITMAAIQSNLVRGQSHINNQKWIDETQTLIKKFKDQSTRYLTLPRLPGELVYWNEINKNTPLVATSMEKLFDLEKSGGRLNEKRQLLNDLKTQINNTNLATTKAIAHDANASRKIADKIDKNRHSVTFWSLLFAVFGIFVSLALAFFAFQIFIRHEQLSNMYNAALETKVKELESFAGRVAHDIKNPLSRIKMALQSLSKDDLKFDSMTYDIAIRAVTAAVKITDDLLDFARSGAPPKSGEQTNIASALAELHSNFCEKARIAGINLIVDPAPNISILMRSGVLTSILENLLSNAIKYIGSTQNKHIHVRNKCDGLMIRIEIEDSGPGIPTQLHDEIFKPFFRVTTEGAEGTGLGLATVKKLIETNGGSVGVISEVGKGSLFWFQLQISDMQSKK